MSEPETDTKQRILAAAEAEFLASGYDRARMQAIADRAQINKAMLHYHYRSKQALFAHIIREKAGHIFPKGDGSRRNEDDFIQFTCRFVDAYFSMLRGNPHFPALLLELAANHEELLEEVAPKFPAMFVSAFNRAAQKGLVRPLDARQLVVSLLGMCVMPFVGKNLIKSSLSLDENAFEKLLSERAEEVKRYVVLLLTPESSPAKRRSQ